MISPDLRAAKAAVHNRLNTLRGAITDVNLKAQINATDRGTIADTETWVQKLNGNTITTPEQLDTYAAQVEAAIKTLKLQADKDAVKARIETARTVVTAIPHADLKAKINTDYGAGINNPATDSADDLNAWINTAANAGDLAKFEG
jgi:hypothetical protein